MLRVDVGEALGGIGQRVEREERLVGDVERDDLGAPRVDRGHSVATIPG